MGKFLTEFINIQELIYKNQIVDAKNSLVKLLNELNVEYKTLRDPFEKKKRFVTLNKLIPALQDLKRNEVSETVIKELKLDRSRLIKEETSNTKEINSDDDLDIFDDIEPTKETPKKTFNKPKQNNPQKLIPLTLDDYIGQAKAKETLRISINAAKKENRVLNHLMICSSYGLGKTTLANIIANEMEMPFISVNASNLKDARSISLYFSKIQEPCIVFIDEIHNLKNDVQTTLLSILTDYKVTLIDENGDDTSYDLPPFTLIGATTQAGELLKPFINRFTILELEDYTDQEKDIIVYSKFQKLGYDIEEDAKKEVSKRSRGIPRTIETFAKGIRDIALTLDTKTITLPIVLKYFELYEIDPVGLNKSDLNVLKVLSEQTKPIALITLESKTGIQKEDLEYRNEPYLIKLGFIEKTERGRVITPKGLEYLNGPEEKGDPDIDPSETSLEDETPVTPAED